MMNRQLLPYLDSFRDELEKIAMIGTILGAGAGLGMAAGASRAAGAINKNWKLGPKGLLLGTALGAGVGYGADRLAGAGKKVLHDEHERERSALQNYIPSTVSHTSPYGSHVW